MTIIDPAELGSLDPGRFAALVKGASKRELADVMAGPDRAAILAEIFRRFPVQFRRDRAGNTLAVIHWHIGGRADGGSDTYEVLIADGACTVSPAATTEPRLSLTLAGAEFLQLLAGAANPVTMLLTGKIKAKGDLGLAATLVHLFDLPKA